MTRVGGAFLAYALQILLTHWIGGEELGVYLHAFAVCVLLSNFAMAGMAPAAMRFVAPAHAAGEADVVAGFVSYSRRIVLGLGVGIGACVCAYGYCRAQEWQHATPLLLAGAALPIYALLRLQAGIGHALSWFVFWNLPNNILRPAMLVGGVVVLHWADQLRSAGDVMWLHASIIGAIFIGQLWIFRRGISRIVGQTKPAAPPRAWLRTALPLMLASTFTAFYPEVNLVVAEPFLPKSELALFNIAYRTVAFLGLLMIAIDNSQLPRISQLLARGETHQVRKLIRRNSLVKCVGTAIGAALLAAGSPHILALFDDPTYLAGEPVMLLLMVGFLGRAAIGPGGEMLSISGHHNRCVVVYVAGLVATALLAWLLIPPFGIMGAAAGVVVVMLSCDLAFHTMARRHLNLRLDLLAPRP
ncbi:MAG: lipopolysaccharide biosynthesis protein [Planctomycetota bacterium]